MTTTGDVELLSFSLDPGDRAWLERYSEVTGIPVGQVVADAVTVFRSQLAVHLAAHDPSREAQ